MDESRIRSMVDRKITESFMSGLSISSIQSDLKVKINNFKKTISRDNIDFESLYNQYFEDINPIRHRYGITYIKQCEKRIKDLDWLLNNKSKFNLSNFKIFKLIQFKEKLIEKPQI